MPSKAVKIFSESISRLFDTNELIIIVISHVCVVGFHFLFDEMQQLNKFRTNNAAELEYFRAKWAHKECMRIPGEANHRPLNAFIAF